MDKYASRFFTTDDPQTTNMIFELPKTWWSRYYEYEWVTSLIEKDDIVLDAACGISHPFKFWLVDSAKESFACDFDSRITDEQSIVEDIYKDYGIQVDESFIEHYIKGVKREEADLQKLPYEDQTFDKVTCISVLEEIGNGAMFTALSEFKRVLKDDGLIILTLDYPLIDLDILQEQVNELNLEFAGEFNTEMKDNVLFSDMWDERWCFRATIRKKRDS